ncbi:MAG: winged helix-turn-helix domain-containing protein [Acidobacteriales bacterium]|nr:winged helix-turn-helix domain-containing protein [Terriglobales bacterium]
MPADPPMLIRFGVFEMDCASRELRKSGARVRVQDQSFQVLLALVQHPGMVVSREDLRKQLWPEDTFVDFDHGLSTIVNKLREALGDSASNPRFIETLAKRGYRFIATVEKHERGSKVTEGSNRSTDHIPAGQAQPARPLLTTADELPFVRRGRVRAPFALIQIMYLSFYVAALARLPRIEQLLDDAFGKSHWLTILLIISGVAGIPVRFYLLSAIAFDLANLSNKFKTLFPAIFLIDELWSLAPFLLAPQIGLGLAFAVTAALTYVPFAQRTLVLMNDRSRAGNLEHRAASPS